MKKLQNNFTTAEQSKRLLELGVPADSADLFYSKFECETFVNRPALCYDKRYSGIVPYGYEKDYLPCWSVGRLIEIMKICSNGVATWYLRSTDKEPLIEQWIDFLESGLFENDFDYKKLEE